MSIEQDLQMFNRLMATRFVVLACENLDLDNDEIENILSLPAKSVTGLFTKEYCLDPGSRPWVAAIELSAIYRQLVSIMGSVEGAKEWVLSFNTKLDCIPLSLLQTKSGRKDILDHLYWLAH